MKKQDVITRLLLENLQETRVGIIVKGIGEINPIEIATTLATQTGKHYFISAVGYDTLKESECDAYTLSPAIEEAVLWRSNPECAGRIIAFVKNDTDKLHSLAEFDIVTTRNLSLFIIEQQIETDTNTPTLNFWNALKETSDYYSFESMLDFVSAVEKSVDKANAIPDNMWRLNLLRDQEILGTKVNARDRLAQNRDLIFKIAQLSEESRKALSRSLASTKVASKENLTATYRQLQSYYKYGKASELRSLELSMVKELFSASQRSKKNGKKQPTPSIESSNPEGQTEIDNLPIRPKQMAELISDAVISDDNGANEDIKTLLAEFKTYYDKESTSGHEKLIPVGGIFQEREIVLDSHSDDLRKLVGKACNSSAWGGLLETAESVLKDVISADIEAFHTFDPKATDSIISFAGGIDGSQALFDFLVQFDAQFNAKGIENIDLFEESVQSLSSLRDRLLENLDLIMYQPVLLFGADNELRNTLIAYVEAWGQLYHAFSVNEPIMRQISGAGTSYAARALLLLDILYIKTPTEWKAILLPLHPIYLWRYFEVFKALPKSKQKMNDEDKAALKEVLTRLPQVLSFVIANSVITGTMDDKVLPCSGSIEMLPTFENKTNRYLGDDGIESFEEVLNRWIGFAPYTQNEIRICSVDAPDLVGCIRQIKSFMGRSNCKRVVYSVYLTRNQNGNTELSKLDYSGRDYEIGEYIRHSRISISIRNVASNTEVKEDLNKHPVHIAFYFDQSSYTIEYGPNNHSLYITPLVINYDYEFDEMQHRGSLFPSSETDSGIIGDYHRLMRAADVISNNMNPRTTYSGNADMTAVVSTIKEGLTQWLVVADRDTNNYQPEDAIPIGEMQYEKRMVNVWTSSESRIITQYLTMLRGYNLYPQSDTLVQILKQFGHIASNGLISIPRFGADQQAIDNKKKGLLGTLFAASWYTNRYKENSMVASLDDDRARIWLQENPHGDQRADLIGLHYDENKDVLCIEPIEVKTRDEAPDATIRRGESGDVEITNHAADQLATTISILRDIFTLDEAEADMFTAARREVLKYQIVSECFRNVHEVEWQKKWKGLLDRAFRKGDAAQIEIKLSGVLLHIKLNEAGAGERIICKHPDYEGYEIEYNKLTARDIQKQVLGETTVMKESFIADFDETLPDAGVNSDDAIVDVDIEIKDVPSTDLGQSEAMETVVAEAIELQERPVNTPPQPTEVKHQGAEVSKDEIDQLVRDFKHSCSNYHVALKECDASKVVVGPSVIRLNFKLGQGQALQGLSSHLDDIGREMKRSGVIIQRIPNSDELLLDVPRLQKQKVLFKDVIEKMPRVTSPEQLYFPLGKTPNGKDLIEDLGQMPHMLVGGSTGSGKSVFLFTMLASLLMTHPRKEDMQLILSSSKLEDFIHFSGLPHLYADNIISDAVEATRVIKEVIFEESERRGELLAKARVANITEYNKKMEEKLAPIVVIIDEFADLADQLESKKEQNAFYKPVQRIAQAGRSRGIHLVICTQRPEAKLVPPTTKAQLNGRVALRVNDGISSRMIIESPDAQYLQKYGDLIYKNGDKIERAQGYLIEVPELDEIVQGVISGKYNK